jgi:excisionase family DNA binding protein
MTLLKLSEVADRWGVSVDTVRRRIADGLLPVHRDGRRIVRISETDLARYEAVRRDAVGVSPRVTDAPGLVLPPGARLWDDA